ncbi:MAG TPA: ABC transporter substrate-binding protein [Steroidobacteraceae bacterium]|nr:ABC transporter substrate-binding protein [Steroidobacteraceae bacterium]
MRPSIPAAAASAFAAMIAVGVLAAGAAAPVRAAAAASAPADQDPSQLIRDVANGLLKDLDANRAAYRKDPQLLKQLADKYLLPHFDIQYSARLVLGRYWRTATDDQRARFVDAFENSMLQNYGSALVDFTANRLKVLPTRSEPGADIVSVPTQIVRDDGSTVPVNYVMHRTPEGWKVWDVNIEGISYVKSFRDDFASQIDQQGLEAVIKRLQAGGRVGPQPGAGRQPRAP